MSATPNNQPKTKKELYKIIEQLIDDNARIGAELLRHQECAIKLPLDPTIDQLNQVIEWSENCVNTIKERPVKVEEFGSYAQDLESESHV